MESFPNMQSNEEKSLEKSMDEYLKSLGYHRKKIAKDGSCLFRAVAEQVLFCQSQHTKVRATCVDYLKRYRENYEAFIEGDFEEYLLKLEDPQHWVGEVEISALALMYRRDFIIFQDVGKQPVSITNNGFEDKVRLCFLNGNHYDSVYPISRVKTAAYCQSLLYGLLYEQVCGVDHSIVSNGLRGNRGNNPLSDDVMEPCRSSDESDTEGESTSWSSEGAGNSGLRLNGHPHKGRGRARLPERVRRSLNPNLWRNVEYDLWLKSNIAQQKMDFRIAAGMQYTVGDMCQVCLEGRRTYSAYIHEVKSDSGPVTVFIKELGERHTVDLCRLRPPSGENSWSTVAREGRSLGEWETRGGRRRPSHSTTQGISQTTGPAPPGRVMKQSSWPPQAQSTGPASVFVLKEEQLIAAEEEEQNLLQLHDQDSFPALGAPAGDVQIQTGAKGASPPPSPPAAASTASPTASPTAPKSAPAVSVAPLSAPAVSTAPLSALAISVAPLSAPAISTAPLSASAVSTSPLFAPALSTAPMSVSAAPLSAPAVSTAPISVSAAPISAPAVSTAPLYAPAVSAAPLSAPISVSAAPLSAPAVSTAPLYAPAISAAPLSAPAFSAAPLSAPAISAAPLSAPALSAAPLSAPALSAAPLSAPAISAAPLSAPAISAATLSAPPPAPTHSTSSVTTPEYVSAPSPPSPNTSAPSAPTPDPSDLPSPVSSILSPSLDAPVTSPSSSHTAPSVFPYTPLPQDPLPSESCLPGVSQPPPGLQQFLKDPLYPGFPQGPEGEVVPCPPYCLLQSGEDLPRDISIVRFFYNLGVRAYSTPTYLPYHYLLPLQQAFSLQPRGPPPAPLLPPWYPTSSPHQPPSSLGQYENIQAPFSQAPDPPQQSYSLNTQTHPRTGVLPWPPSPRPYSAPAPAPSYPPPLYTPQYPPPNYIPTSYSQNTSYYPPTSLHLPPTYPHPVPPGDSQNQGPVEVTHPASGASPPGHRVGPGPLVDGRGANSSWYEERGQGDGGSRTGSLLGEPLLPVSGPSGQTPVCRLPQFKEVSVVMTTQGACNGPLPMATSEMHRSDSDLTRTYQPTLDMLKGVGPLYAAPPLSHSGSQLEEGEGLESSDSTFRGARIMYSRSRGRGRGQDGNRVRGSYRGRRGSYDDRDRRYDGSHDRRYGEYTFKATPTLYQDRGRGRGYSYYPTNGRDTEYLSGHRNGPYASS